PYGCDRGIERDLDVAWMGIDRRRWWERRVDRGLVQAQLKLRTKTEMHASVCPQHGVHRQHRVLFVRHEEPALDRDVGQLVAPDGQAALQSEFDERARRRVAELVQPATEIG